MPGGVSSQIAALHCKPSRATRRFYMWGRWCSSDSRLVKVRNGVCCSCREVTGSALKRRTYKLGCALRELQVLGGVDSKLGVCVLVYLCVS